MACNAAVAAACFTAATIWQGVSSVRICLHSLTARPIATPSVASTATASAAATAPVNTVPTAPASFAATPTAIATKSVITAAAIAVAAAAVAITASAVSAPIAVATTPCALAVSLPHGGGMGLLPRGRQRQKLHLLCGCRGIGSYQVLHLDSQRRRSAVHVHWDVWLRPDDWRL